MTLDSFNLGLDVMTNTENNESIDLEQINIDRSNYNFDFTVSPCFYGGKEPKGKQYNELYPICGSDRVLNNEVWTSHVIIKIPLWITQGIISNKNNEKYYNYLNNELDFAKYVGSNGVIIPIDLENINTDFFLFLLRKCDNNTQNYLLQFKLSNDLTIQESIQLRLKCQRIRKMLKNSCKILFALEFGTNSLGNEMYNWLSENIATVIVPTDIFLTNKGGFPVLSKHHKNIVKRFIHSCKTIILRGPCLYDNKTYNIYQAYFGHLHKSIEGLCKSETYSFGYEDMLMDPLQPLSDNLSMYTYNVFELDDTKYNAYYEAIKAAIKDKPNCEFVCILGGGRGPIVTKVVEAVNDMNSDAKVIVVEKNPNAIITLKDVNSKEWNNKVKIILGDMRDPKILDRKVDIIVSELLGSFSDNELSPECLDVAMSNILKDDGISIPSSYLSYITPISSAKMWINANQYSSCNDEVNHERIYVVKSWSSTNLSKTQPLFEFIHSPNTEIINSETQNRYKSLVFNIDVDAEFHGFLGYFSCILYKNISLETTPENHTKGLFSWFPMYIPIVEPIVLKKDDILTVEFWRRSDNIKMWYEWIINTPVQSNIHNFNGDSYKVNKIYNWAKFDTPKSKKEQETMIESENVDMDKIANKDLSDLDKIFTINDSQMKLYNYHFSRLVDTPASIYNSLKKDSTVEFVTLDEALIFFENFKLNQTDIAEILELADITNDCLERKQFCVALHNIACRYKNIPLGVIQSHHNKNKINTKEKKDTDWQPIQNTRKYTLDDVSLFDDAEFQIDQNFSTTSKSDSSALHDALNKVQSDVQDRDSKRRKSEMTVDLVEKTTDLYINQTSKNQKLKETVQKLFSEFTSIIETKIDLQIQLENLQSEHD
ncbi:Protein arginine N-methyltransferase 5 [Intoshia linei]|uniref:Protein arginine N-methyltransferase 5 n=1 Tax=Intoshia linei TaxID=1819745 RepID=A0A177B0A7_9BILA|nr:Protein arginine N-methyltransferase 5 [Intoshia linei]